ncbi:DUF742 domain-containing protein [Actinomadura sp. NPDC048955]|uniref:DUF742 domain-containing protein n=1 Tax=Actinomadura sp. NPDC048955 TaxID=3158228 RepID=UPI0033E9B707
MAGASSRDPRRPPQACTGQPAGDPAGHPVDHPQQDEAWAAYDVEEIRPYALTRGRTRPKYPMRLVTLLEAVGTTGVARAQSLAPEAAQAVEACRLQPCSVVEIAALIGQPVHVTKIILSDLIDCEALVMARPAPGTGDHLQLLEGLLAGLETRLSGVA